MALPRKLCRHCRQRFVNRSRGLCFMCFNDPEIKAQYPSRNKAATAREPTMAELDAMVAERSRPENLPRWWHREGERRNRRSLWE